ncbi:MAG TPA: cytochrome c [Gammaproteobacteria bacterium]
MKRLPSRIAAAGAFIGMAMLAGCGGGGPAEVEDTPEGEAFVFRDAVMHAVAYKMTPIGGMARGEIPVDDAVFRKAASDVATLSGMLLEGFMPQGIPAGSRATPDIWMNWTDFEQRAKAFQDAAQAVAEAAESGGVEAARDLVRPLLDTCGGCHRTYRAPEEG